MQACVSKPSAFTPNFLRAKVQPIQWQIWAPYSYIHLRNKNIYSPRNNLNNLGIHPVRFLMLDSKGAFYAHANASNACPSSP